MRHAVSVALFFAILCHSARASDDLKRHALYVDALGRGGLWGLGYDYQLASRFTLGATTSFYVLDSQQILTLSPYLSYYPFMNGEHRWLFQAGPQIIRESTLSPVPEWSGISSTGVSAAVASGYEYRSNVLLRIYGMLALGRGQISPWIGLSIGWLF